MCDGKQLAAARAEVAELRSAVMALHETTQVVPVGNGMVRVDVLMVSSDRLAALCALARREEYARRHDA